MLQVWGFDAMFPAMHTRNNTLIGNDFSNLVRDSCDPGLLESYGVGKGQRVLANAIHDVSIPPKRWGRANEADSMGVQILFSDAQTHFSEYRDNVLYEIVSNSRSCCSPTRSCTSSRPGGAQEAMPATLGVRHTSDNPLRFAAERLQRWERRDGQELAGAL